QKKPLPTGRTEKNNRQSVQNAITLQKSNGRSRATAPTECVERKFDCKMQLHCKTQPSCKAPTAVGRVALSGSAGQPPCNKLRPDKCN
ncbi:MAG: hypothetical protein RSD78_03955, partial [Oscillospiraceae bacterium]